MGAMWARWARWALRRDAGGQSRRRGAGRGADGGGWHRARLRLVPTFSLSFLRDVCEKCFCSSAPTLLRSAPTPLLHGALFWSVNHLKQTTLPTPCQKRHAEGRRPTPPPRRSKATPNSEVEGWRSLVHARRPRRPSAAQRRIPNMNKSTEAPSLKSRASGPKLESQARAIMSVEVPNTMAASSNSEVPSSVSFGSLLAYDR